MGGKAVPAAESIGQRYGRLVVLAIERGRRGSIAICRCDCGAETRVSISQIRKGKTRSCGCLRAERSSARLTAKYASNPPRVRSCSVCGETRKIAARDLCYSCYRRERSAPRVRRHGICAGCGRVEIRIAAQVLCYRCRARERKGLPRTLVQIRPRVRACSTCGEIRAIAARDLCWRCYGRARRSR